MEMRYILIAEDGYVYQADKITDDEKDANISGVLDIVDTKTMQQYFNREWHDIRLWSEVSGA